MFLKLSHSLIQEATIDDNELKVHSSFSFKIFFYMKIILKYIIEAVRNRMMKVIKLPISFH
jgi:hypothetical protein